MSRQSVFLSATLLLATAINAPTAAGQSRVLATPFGGSRLPVQPEQNITYGGVLPAPMGEPDIQVGMASPKPTDWDPAAASAAVQSLSDACERFTKAVRGIDNSINEKSDWIKRAEKLSSLANVLERTDFTADGRDADWTAPVTDLSLEARSLNQAIAGRLREGLATDVFPTVRDAAAILRAEIVEPLEPLERAAGVTPIPSSFNETSANVESNGVPSFGVAPLLPQSPLYETYRPAIPVPVPVPSFGGLGFGGPSFEFRLDIAPGLSAYGYQPFGIDRYDYDRYRYDSYRYDYRNRLDGYGPHVGIPVYPAPAFRYGFGAPVLPYGHGPAFGW